MLARTLIATLALTATAAPALAQGPWDWTGGRPGSRDYRLAGAGVRLLIPELRATNRGRAFVMRNFDRNRDGLVQPREAELANRAFIEIAGARRARFDWEVYDRRPMLRAPAPVPPLAQAPRPGRWDRRAMRDYGFRQTARGATMTLSEAVLFATDSATLRPGAVDKLRPLADYLRDNAGVRVSIDGYTDSRGSDAYNKGLSLRRADAVRAAFDDLGVTRARFSVDGHGEADPVAPNTTAAGMQQNRRVEVTLLGRRVEEFRD
jgi:outer membrane protein OmpA-like peptidoglycan-associated protein